jgi:hypothetical protein
VQPAPGKTQRKDPHEARLAIESFLKASRQPVLMEPGEDPLPIVPERFALESRGGAVRLECWSETHNLVRRVRGVRVARRGRLELEVEHFGGRAGTLTLVDLADPSNRDADRRGARLKYRERFRRSLRRQFPDWRLAELSTEPDLHHSLSPSYPRAFLRRGSAGLAAIGAAEDASAPEEALSFGLIWLDYLRGREPRLAIEGLAVFVPAGAESTTCHRVRYLNPRAARFMVFVHDAGHEDAVDPRDYTNFDTRLNPCCRPLGQSSLELAAWVERIAAIEGVQRRDHVDGSAGLAVRGLEFARAAGETLLFGLDRKHVAGGEAHLAEIEQLARGLARMRDAGAADRMNPLYTSRPEAWLESQVRARLDTLDATLWPSPVYGQVPQFAAGERSVIDLLAADRDGRLAVIEVKADQDIHLPLQALDYWMRVKWHLERGEFSGCGYFSGLALTHAAPRLLLVAPALDYHPSNETVLRYFSPEIAVERFGVGIEWRRDFKVMFRIPSHPWPSPSSASSRKPSRA